MSESSGGIPPRMLRCCVTGGLRNDSPAEHRRQRWARSLMIEYGYKNKDLGIGVKVHVNGRPKNADLVVYRSGAVHEEPSVQIVLSVNSTSVLPTDRRCGVESLQRMLSALPGCQHGLWIGRERIGLEKLSAGSIVQIADIPGRRHRSGSVPSRDALRPAQDLQASFRRCHDYMHTNSGLHKGDAFHEFVKLLFCKTLDEEGRDGDLRFRMSAYERGVESAQRRLLEERLMPLFQDVMRRHPQVFEREESLRIEPHVATYVVSELQWTSLSATPADVRGSAYEELVGGNLRGDRGEFFTPKNVCDLAVSMVASLVGRERLAELRVLDCCCGAGGFLVSWLNGLSRFGLDRQSIDQACAERTFGLDINPHLVRACRMNLALHGDGRSNAHRANSAALPGEWDAAARHAVPHGEIDVVLTNPPFGSRVRVDDPHLLSSFELPKWGRAGTRSAMPPEQLFVEAALRFLRPGGLLAIVLPRGILNNPSCQFMRTWLLARTRIVAVIDLPETTFATSQGVNHPSLLLVQKAATGELPAVDYEIFMSCPATSGVNRRGKPLYLRRADGTEFIGAEGDRIRDDEVSAVAVAFQEWAAQHILPLRS